VVAFLAVVMAAAVVDSVEHSCCERERKVSLLKGALEFRDSEAGSWGATVLVRRHPYHFHHHSL
jgi:hypothetical protein